MPTILRSSGAGGARRIKGAVACAPPPDDLVLMRAIAAGDHSALSLLYDRYSTLLYSICRHILRDACDAEDVLLDVFLEVWSRSDRFDATRGGPMKYLVTLTWSRALDHSRSQSNRWRMTSNGIDVASRPSSMPGPLRSIEEMEKGAIVRKALAELHPAHREALTCAFYDGLSHRETATKLKKPLGTVKTHIRQGIIRLRDLLRANR